MKTFNEEAWLKFRADHPELRYWQALRQFCEVAYIWHEVEEGELVDTFYIEDTPGDKA